MSQSDTKPSAEKAAVRSHETRVEIDAPIEEVWKAITEAEAMARWFAPSMTVAPGVGGSVLADWGPGIEWKTVIEVWEPNRHLRLTETRDKVLSASPVEQPLESCRLVQDYYLESKGGRTVLRLVHSGFGSSAEWDSEYEGTRGGWAGCFFRLKQGLERHRNETVRNVMVNAVFPGLDPERALRAIESAFPPSFETALRGDLHVCGLLPADNGSILNVSVGPAPNGSIVYMELLLFGLQDARAAALESEWRAKLAELFASAATA